MQFRLLARQYGAALQATPWLHVFGYAALVLFFGKLLAWLMPAGLPAPFNQVVVVAALLLTSGTIPLASIASCESVNEKRAEWCKRKCIRAHSPLLVSPFDQPTWS